MGRSFTIEIMRTPRQHFLSSTKAKTHSAFVFKPGAFNPAFIKHLFAKRLLCGRNRGSTRNTAVMTRNVPAHMALTFYGGEAEDKHRKTNVPSGKAMRSTVDQNGSAHGEAGWGGQCGRSWRLPGPPLLPSSPAGQVLSRRWDPGPLCTWHDRALSPSQY